MYTCIFASVFWNVIVSHLDMLGCASTHTCRTLHAYIAKKGTSLTDKELKLGKS